MREWRAARLTARVTTSLAGDLAPQEHIAMTVRVTQGSVILQIALTLAGAAIVWTSWETRQQGTAGVAEPFVLPAIFILISLLVDLLVLKRRVLVLTGSRLLLCRRGPFGAIGRIDEVRDRHSIRIERPERDRIVVVSEDLPSLRVRVPYYFAEPSEAIAAWASVGR